MALLRLALQWANGSARISVLTLDHGLRPGAAAEAAKVAEWCTLLGVEHHTLRWEGTKPETGLQAKARSARYDLLCNWCKANQVKFLLTGHTMDDQAETVLMRQARTDTAESLAGIWQTAGFSAIMYLAALSSVPPELHEAAKVDGASLFRRTLHIDLPSIMPIAVILLILSVGNILNTGFEKVLLLQNPLNLTVSQVIDTYVYEVGLKSPIPQFSYATAIGLFKSVVGLILLLAVNFFANKTTKSGLF